MPALAPYIPPQDAAFSNWFLNFETLIAASPATYGLLAADATLITATYASWIAAYNLVTSPTTKTAAAVSAKNTAKVNSLGVIRPYAQTISLNPAVSSGNKIALGLNPRTSTPTPVTPPTSNPILALQSYGPGIAILRYRDSSASPSVKAKPYGVRGLNLYAASSSTPITDPTQLAQIVRPTKSPFILNVPGLVGPVPAYLAARWAIQTGGLSPWSPIIKLNIPAAG